MVVSVSLPIEQNVSLYLSILLFTFTLIGVSMMMGKSISVPVWKNPRKAYNLIDNKKIIDILKEHAIVKGQP